jgi:predicted ATP-dependent protease
MQESIQRGIRLIDTDGAAIGQINGLAVVGTDGIAFGTPTRITATTRLGEGRIVDIERETALGGATHTKGVLILSNFLASRYARNTPLALAASIVFEQSYGAIDGDSASLAELCALISSLADIPLSLAMAVTGSVNQLGEVQAIGGVNEKIEGFFDLCLARGLSAGQGVIIPASNVEHLMLREEIVTACTEGRFEIHGVRHVDEALELLTGRTAGKPDSRGAFPGGSVNRAVAYRLAHFARHRAGHSAVPGAGVGEPP